MPIYPDGTFKPNNSITRGEFIKAVNNIFEFEEMVEIQFKDINEEDPFIMILKRLWQLDILMGMKMVL